MDPSAQQATNPSQTIASLLLSQIPKDKKLFHYTDAAGLLGMAEYQQIWMTNMHYQNDGEEYYYTFNLFKEIIEQEYPGLLTEEELLNIGKTASGTFTFSLTAENDSLSQWRGYCPNGGFALSFDTQQLNQVMQREHLVIAECVYDRARQRQLIIDNIIKITPEQYLVAITPTTISASGTGSTDVWLHSWGVAEALNYLSAILKHPSFFQEQEWRLIRTLGSAGRGAFSSNTLFDIAYANRLSLRTDISIRSSKNKLIPYVAISLKHDEKPISFKEVVISPTPHKARELDACKILLNKYDASYLCRPNVRNSIIPYVNW
jgi:hypothetical protein